MPKRTAHSTALIRSATFLLLALAFTSARADWPTTTDGLPICVRAGEQDGALAAPDGSGGSIFCWTDATSPSAPRVYAQRATQMGSLLWAANGIPLLLGTVTSIAPDGNGGVFMLVTRGSILYAQRLDASGASLWGSAGVIVCSAAGGKGPARSIVKLADGGAIFTWMDSRSGSFAQVPYSQRLSAAGAPLWTPNGVALTTLSTTTYGGLSAVTDGANGVIVTWDNYNDVFAQHLDSNGTPVWGPNGINVTDPAAYTQIHVEAAPDGNGGAYLAWWDSRVMLNSAYSDIYGQHLDSNGNALWAPTGIPLVAAAWAQRNVSLAADASGGVLLAWQDGRAGASGSYDIYAQRVNAAGVPQWAADGVRLTSATTTSSSFSNRTDITADGFGGVIVTWMDTPSAGVYQIRTQRVSSNGSPLWSAGGVLTGAGAAFRYRPSPAADGTGGVIVSWYDSRGGNGDIYAQRIDASGMLGPGGITAVELSLASLEVTRDGVQIAWQSGRSNPTAALERCSGSGDWHELAELTRDGLGRFSHVDRNVVAGERYGYRLRFQDRAVVEYAGETWVEVPGTDQLSLAPLASPSRAVLDVRFSLPDAADATIELLDVSGRVLCRMPVGERGAGMHRVTLNTDRALQAGMYFVRLSQGANAVVKRVSVLR